MNVLRGLCVIAFLGAASNCAAMSKLFYEGVAATIKNGQPCFYLYRPGDRNIKLEFLNDFYVSVILSAEKWEQKWETRLNRKDIVPPAAAESCLLYGTMPHANKKSVPPLLLDQRYQIIFSAAQARFGANFCLEKDTNNNLYVSDTDHLGHCSKEPLPNKIRPHPWWLDWIGF